jgi:hypothetical protein
VGRKAGRSVRIVARKWLKGRDITHAGVARRANDGRRAGILRESPRQGVFATTSTEDEECHGRGREAIRNRAALERKDAQLFRID